MLKKSTVFAATFVAMAAATAAEAAQNRCVVPKIEVCQGCLRKVNVTPLPGGGCRVTYDVAPQTLVAGNPGDITIEMDIAGPSPVARAPRRLVSRPRWRPAPRPYRRVARSAYRPSAGGRECFWFNGGRVCE